LNHIVGDIITAPADYLGYAARRPLVVNTKTIRKRPTPWDAGETSRQPYQKPTTAVNVTGRVCRTVTPDALTKTAFVRVIVARYRDGDRPRIPGGES
jgi:hypothetical protein